MQNPKRYTIVGSITLYQLTHSYWAFMEFVPLDIYSLFCVCKEGMWCLFVAMNMEGYFDESQKEGITHLRSNW